MADAAILARIDALQIRYVTAVDHRQWEEWKACFDGEASYICTTQENEAQGLPVAIMMDDTRARIADRVKFITEVWSDTYEDYSTRHFVQRLTCRATSADLFEVESNLSVFYTTAQGRSSLLCTGLYRDIVRLSSLGDVFVSKNAILDTFTTPRYLVYPI